MQRRDLPNAGWFKSSYSNGQGGGCIGAALDDPSVSYVADTKLGDESPVLAFNPKAFAKFVQNVKDGKLPS
jgi:hypothetical protein